MTQYRCPGCGYVYDEARGNAHEGFAPGTAWAAIPEEWACPDCSVRDKPDFLRVEPGAVSSQAAPGASSVRGND